MPAGVAAGHPATAEVALRVLGAGGSAADAAVAAVLTCSATESILTGIGGGGFATYYDAATRTVTCLDFFCSVPGLDGTEPGPMVPVEINFGGMRLPYSIGAASVGVPGVPAGCGEVHRRWGRLPWQRVVAPAISLAHSGVVLPAPQARTLESVAPALLPGEGAGIYAPTGRLLDGGDLLYHRGLDQALAALAEDGPAVFYTGKLGELLVDAVRAGGGALGPADLAAYRVLELPVERATLGGGQVFGRHDLNGTIATIAALPADLATRPRPERAVAVAGALREYGRQKLGDTTNVSVVDLDGNACVITTTLGVGAGVWLPGYGINLNSMLGEGELITPDLAPGRRMSSMMCPVVVVDGDGHLVVAAGSAGASRIRTALLDTLLGVLIDGLDMPAAVARSRFHVVDDTVHAELGYPEDELAALADAGYTVNRWDELNHYFGGVSAVGLAGAAGDPRRGGVGLLL
ncbi:MAG TPA: gamma-glutamyltransferase [Pilimelia sp.]|nr:gamma-glutamyltransferase [Pilimelia sp.]